MNAVGVAIVPGAIVGSAVGGIIGNRVDTGFVKVWDATVKFLRKGDRTTNVMLERPHNFSTHQFSHVATRFNVILNIWNQ